MVLPQFCQHIWIQRPREPLWLVLRSNREEALKGLKYVFSLPLTGPPVSVT